MERQSNDNEQRTIEEEEGTKSKPSSGRENVQAKASSTRQPLSNKPSSHTDIKRFDTLCPVILDHRSSILEIRRTAQQCSHNEDDQSTLITINVSGNRFQTYLSTLQIYPDTLLGDENKRQKYWNSTTQEYFFNRHRACFESILYYYQSNGRLRRPESVPLDTFLEEISYFQLGTEASDQVHQTENISIVTQIPMPRILWRRYIWYYLEFPQHSSLSRGINILSMFFTILSCLALAIETLPVYKNHWQDICKTQANMSSNSTDVPRCFALFTSPFFIIQTICVIYFLIEFLLRLASTPSYFRFILSAFNWIDLGTIVPYFVFLAIEASNRQINLNTDAALGIRLLRLLRFARVFKFYVVTQNLKALRVLSSTLKESLVDFTIIITISGIVAFLFGAATYFAEQEANGDVFDSIPKATYWGIITISGVGYGDMYPVTAVGRILTCLCALFGAGMMGMLVSVLVDRYQRVYNRKMYVPQHEIPAVEFKRFRSSQDEEGGIKDSSQKASRRQQLSSIASHHLTSVRKKFKPASPHRASAQSYKVHFAVSFDGENIDSYEAQNIAASMKEKMTEAVPENGANIELRLMEKKNNRLWTTFNSDSAHDPPTSNDANVNSPNLEAV